MFVRHISDTVLSAAGQNPVVTIMGPRQSGKTTLCRALFPDHDYRSLEAPDVRLQALEDPRGFLASANPMIIDEVQRAPDLLSYIQVLVDEDCRPGRFILTGSQNLLLMESVSQTLAGRVALLNLLPLSIAELLAREPFDPAKALRSAPDASLAANVNRWDTLFAGFYPRIHDRGLSPREWLGDYFRTYVERDLREVMQVSDLRAFEDFVRLAAASTARELNLSRLASDVGVGQQTARRWLNALEISYLAVTLPPHFANFRKRLRKRPRLHFLDTGLICYLLDIPDAETLARHPLRGAIFESFVASELFKSFANRRKKAPLYTWRDTSGHEIDILIDLGQRLIPVEVKSGETVAPDAMRNLAWWAALPGNPNQHGFLVHGGTRSFRHKNFAVLPWRLS
ncbi:MAG: ATP-binding protein [Gammaproteobacteria bacterium]|nr:ATP-binding protein [Gammaproteobacteria bacterium]MXW45247.1 ATP-binding protein [Gammaproteobacteria bacterium]MYD01163.1 ATP-binding protein [Gammaproteobacteria bacterium]MYI24911.1 ATP-binding protein [Gammaproteobacteria bacterium]